MEKWPVRAGYLRYLVATLGTSLTLPAKADFQSLAIILASVSERQTLRLWRLSGEGNAGWGAEGSKDEGDGGQELQYNVYGGGECRRVADK